MAASSFTFPVDKFMRIFHIFALFCYVFGILYDTIVIGDAAPISRGYGGKMKFLTSWNACLQTLYFAVCVVVDLKGDGGGAKDVTKKKSGLRKFRDDFFGVIAFPVGTFVVLTFWVLYAVDRELVYPRVLDGIIPTWLNHVMHTAVLPFILLEKYTIYHRYPSRRTGLLSIIFFASLYQIWVMWIAYYADYWVYPVLSVLSWPQRGGFLGMLTMFLISLYILGEALTGFIWRHTIASSLEQKHRVKKVK